ncbi:group I intron-associated PD-(D/E)XK endonuclease [Bacillus subtilis]|uniref:group I intron-associated PD-(D/E)XK endonuclease n=1 Tax=Bacillus subtilis TaxID=1423 RepID=UPI002DB67E02|nr:group I intron-associated PD-(D/E)XK endonuclease [Bacillus subtilis]MEC0429347.1 group I intron-associated PD-(D/E)XK endonuclease [Bacillus subtilis]
MGSAISKRNFYGYAAENIVRADLAKKEIISLSPDIPWTHYDMVADINGSFVKIQVKTKMEHDGYRMIIDNRKSNGISRPYTKSDYDVLAIVDLESRRVGLHRISGSYNERDCGVITNDKRTPTARIRRISIGIQHNVRQVRNAYLR